MDAVLKRSESDPGVVGIAYFPVLDGQHQLDIRVRGVSISGCPVAVEVRHGRNYAEIAAQGELFSFGKEGERIQLNLGSIPLSTTHKRKTEVCLRGEGLILLLRYKY
ncbi:unnamed protein product [Strongylus vulgaris]|uniref:Uncharacterized protein n=1 Tax=Strongylus vulgaris TaxID=40348 RepID=A0A3P7JC50_STRVU|nr:unnamed protein product [Strongylus vulgaris]